MPKPSRPRGYKSVPSTVGDQPPVSMPTEPPTASMQPVAAAPVQLPPPSLQVSAAAIQGAHTYVYIHLPAAYNVCIILYTIIHLHVITLHIFLSSHCLYTRLSPSPLLPRPCFPQTPASAPSQSRVWMTPSCSGSPRPSPAGGF